MTSTIFVSFPPPLPDEKLATKSPLLSSDLHQIALPMPPPTRRHRINHQREQSQRQSHRLLGLPSPELVSGRRQAALAAYRQLDQAREDSSGQSIIMSGARVRKKKGKTTASKDDKDKSATPGSRTSKRVQEKAKRKAMEAEGEIPPPFNLGEDDELDDEAATSTVEAHEKKKARVDEESANLDEAASPTVKIPRKKKARKEVDGVDVDSDEKSANPQKNDGIMSKSKQVHKETNLGGETGQPDETNRSKNANAQGGENEPSLDEIENFFSDADKSPALPNDKKNEPPKEQPAQPTTTNPEKHSPERDASNQRLPDEKHDSLAMKSGLIAVPRKSTGKGTHSDDADKNLTLQVRPATQEEKDAALQNAQLKILQSEHKVIGNKPKSKNKPAKPTTKLPSSKLAAEANKKHERSNKPIVPVKKYEYKEGQQMAKNNSDYYAKNMYRIPERYESPIHQIAVLASHYGFACDELDKLVMSGDIRETLHVRKGSIVWDNCTMIAGVMKNIKLLQKNIGKSDNDEKSEEDDTEEIYRDDEEDSDDDKLSSDRSLLESEKKTLDNFVKLVRDMYIKYDLKPSDSLFVVGPNTCKTDSRFVKLIGCTQSDLQSAKFVSMNKEQRRLWLFSSNSNSLERMTKWYDDIREEFGPHHSMAFRYFSTTDSSYTDVCCRGQEQSSVQVIKRELNIDPALASVEDGDGNAKEKKKSKKTIKGDYKYNDNKLQALNRKTAFEGNAGLYHAESWPHSRDHMNLWQIECYNLQPDLTSGIAWNFKKVWVITPKTNKLSKLCHSCDEHDACCHVPRPNDLVKIDASCCFLVHGHYWVVPVRRYTIDHKWKCIVGYVKVLWNQLGYVGNRIAMVKSINCDDYRGHTQKNADATWMTKSFDLVVEAWFVDGIMNSSVKTAHVKAMK